jgi:phosphate:Na+ symporter
LKGVLVGAGVTFLIQSSSATVGMVVEFASKGLMTLPAGVAVMLGAELGTCSDTLLATVGRGRAALKTAVFHLGFNVLTITLGVLFIDALVGLVTLVAGQAHVERQIAHAHVLFNVLGVLLFAPLVPLAQRLLDAGLPDKVVEKKSKSKRLQATPA